MAFYKILVWKGIPSQIKAWDDADEVNLLLSSKFMARIDHVAQSEGLTGTDEYLAQWEWTEEREREGTAGEVAYEVQQELESAFGGS